jgi:hypothetical protein
MVGFQQQMRILHWQTKKYARHMAYGSIYDTLDDLIDTFTETCMGKYGRVELQNMSDLSVNGYISDFIEFLKGLNEDFDSSKDSDVLNVRDEIMGECNKLRYLLTLD